ncbi:MAG TPA: ABC transporter ATP-binding protein, partial [Candidatus Hydrogenedentes bacterium]|nr:ABC transporter ATP-binding protein [Candidatus Hydrogenedentota bacterium]
RRSLEKVASMAMVASETFNGIAIVKGFCMEAYEIARTSVEFGKLRRYLVKMVKVDAAVGPVVEFVLILGVVALVLFAGARVMSEEMSRADVAALIFAFALMLDPLRKLSTVNNQIQTSVASAERVFEFIDMQPEIVEKAGARALPRLSEAIRFENVHFAYKPGVEVLKGIDLEVNRGEMVALVGFSGSGKSTIVKLLPRFYDATAGAVRIDGIDIRDVTFESLRDQISIVTQETILFNESVRDNIAFGRKDYTAEQVREAARAAYADAFIEALPEGYETVIGEGGATLSGGQRQRLAIARAIIKDPAILILDEATSHLDSESEQAIQKALAGFVQGRTTIVIAHRLATVQRADRIVVVDQGLIVEHGTHQELLAIGGIYRRLYEQQLLSGGEDVA